MNQQHRFIFWGVLLIVVLLSVSSITFPIFVAQTVKNQNVICIDAGHGGSDPGKVGNSNILEKDINLSLALKLQKLLEKKNYKVYMGTIILRIRKKMRNEVIYPIESSSFLRMILWQ